MPYLRSKLALFILFCQMSFSHLPQDEGIPAKAGLHSVGSGAKNKACFCNIKLNQAEHKLIILNYKIFE
jgi:hypothetical protein